MIFQGANAKISIDLGEQDDFIFEGIYNLFKTLTYIKSDFHENKWKTDDGYNTPTIDFANVFATPTGYSRHEFIRALKCYAVVRLTSGKGVQINSLRREIHYIISICNQTAGFKNHFPSAMTYYDYILVERFMTELDIDTSVLTKVFIEGTPQHRRELNRLFQDYYVIDESVKRFCEENRLNQSDDEITRNRKVRQWIIFGPVVFFWRINCVLPGRPAAFCRIPTDFVRKDDVTGQYYILMPSSIIKGSNKVVTNSIKDYPTRMRPTVEELAEDLLAYQNIVKESYAATSDDYFFNNISYAKITNSKIKSRLKECHLQDRFQLFVEQEIIERLGYTFEKENDDDIIIDQKSKTIGHFRLGDLRHLSIITMIFLGIDPAVIMDLCGHASIEQSCHYYNVDHLTTSYIDFVERQKDKKYFWINEEWNNQEKAGIPGYEVIYGDCFALENERAACCVAVNCQCFRCSKSLKNNSTAIKELCEMAHTDLEVTTKHFVKNFGRTKKEAMISVIQKMQQGLSIEAKLRQVNTWITTRG